MENFARKILEKAANESGQDIYVLPRADDYEIWLRTAQGRKLLQNLDRDSANSLMSHFKFVAGMNVGERRRHQLGSCLYDLEAGVRRLRLSTVGNFEGQESLVIRLLHEEGQSLDFWFDDWKNVKDLISSRGLYLFSGPVGSGKTTLMHALAQEKFANKQVISIEDPVEIINPDFLQLQLNEVIGNDYNALIQLSLRHRPDLVMVGEIRDEKTAHAVIRASLTGYTVFSTIHAKSIKGVYARLLELGLKAGELDNALNGVIYQRLLAGKGLLEVADGNYKNWKPTVWNKKIESLATDGHLEASEAQSEKIKTVTAN